MPSVSESQHRTMEAAKHNRAFARKLKIPQKVARDFVAADKAAGKFQGKEPRMKTTKTSSESGMAGEKGMSPRKAIASGLTSSGNFGAAQMTDMGAGKHPDHTAGTGAKGAMADADRGAPPGVHHTKNEHPAQAAPDHGPTHPGGYNANFRRGPLA